MPVLMRSYIGYKSEVREIPDRKGRPFLIVGVQIPRRPVQQVSPLTHGGQGHQVKADIVFTTNLRMILQRW